MAGGGHANRRHRLSGHKKAHTDAVRNDINVTPLVDVMLVLLIIFMLMTLVMGRGHDVPVPAAKNFSEEKDLMQPVVTIEVDGTLWIEKTRLGPVNDSTLLEMENQIKAGWNKNPDGKDRVYLKAAAKVEYEKVYPVVEYLNRTMFLQSIDLAVGQAREDR